MTAEEVGKMCDLASEQLSEHVEAVQILVSWNENGRTKCYAVGNGNWYARQGMAHEFINRDNAREIANAMSE